MKPTEKIQFIKDLILEKAEISPAGPIWIRLDDIFDKDTKTLIFSISDQSAVIKKFAQDGFLKDIFIHKDKLGPFAIVNMVGFPDSKTTPVKDSFVLTRELKPDITVGELSSYSDGTIRYKDNILPIRNQLKDLCRLFMRNPKRLLTPEDIKENIISADKRKITSNSTISKYVSELRNSLKVHFKKDIIFSQKEEGWHFDINKT